MIDEQHKAIVSAEDRAGATKGGAPSPRWATSVYGEEAGQPLEERDWVVLVNLVAAGDQRALRQLFERTHRLVFSRRTHDA